MHFKFKEYLFIRDLKPASNENLAVRNFISIISIFFVVLCQSTSRWFPSVQLYLNLNLSVTE